MNIIESLKKEKDEQEKIALALRKRESLFRKTPSGMLRVSKSNGVFQYYFKKDGTASYEYVPSSKREIVKELAQRDYETSLLKKLEENTKNIDRFIKHYRQDPVNNVYDKLSEGRKMIIDPVMFTDSMYIEKWYREHPGNMNPYPEKGIITTERGEVVRSKSEKILADMFNKYGIPYQYEPEIQLKGNKTVYPDFILLDIRKRKTYIWEHLGLAGNEDYAVSNLKKIYLYEKSGYHLGVDLLISEESEEMPLDLQLIKEKIGMYFQE